MNYCSVKYYYRDVGLEGTLLHCETVTLPPPNALQDHSWRESSGLDGSSVLRHALLSSELNIKPEQRSLANSPTNSLHLEQQDSYPT